MLGKRYAYRVLWEALNGPTTKNLHHRCENKWCVNPAHLTPLTQSEHAREHRWGGDWGQADKTHCPKEHPYSEENTYHWRGERHCKTCRLEAKRRYLAKKRSE